MGRYNSGRAGKRRLFAAAMAVFVVAIMITSAFPAVSPDSAQAAEGKDDPYEYTINMTNGTSNFRSIHRDDQGFDTGSWGFESNGVGPFNSFYALFSGSTGKMMCHLDPYDLSKDIYGHSVTLTGNNVMWVVPTVYWGVDSNGNLLLSDSDDKINGVTMTAYAHTLYGSDGQPHTYDYIAIGVYEGSVNDKKLMSTLANPTGNLSKDVLTDYARNTPDPEGCSNIWNFYQWELYKYISYAVMGGFDSRSIVGHGHANGSGAIAPNDQNMNQMGPYYGDSDDTGGSKLFIENSWGNMLEWVGGYIQTGSTAYISSKTVPDNTAAVDGDAVRGFHVKYTSEGFVTAIDTSSAAMWGFPLATKGAYAPGSGYFYMGSNASNSRVLCVGGDWNDGSKADISSTFAMYGSLVVGDNMGSRLAFAFDGDAASGDHYAYMVDANDASSDISIESVTDLTTNKATKAISHVTFDPGSWGFDGDGYGPFNSFYAAFDGQTGKMLCHLDPYDLSKSVDGKALSEINTENHEVNVMWVLPKVYTGVDSDGNLILSNHDEVDGIKLTAWAYTLTGKDKKDPEHDGAIGDYDYLAIGVYEASLYDSGNTLGSRTGQVPCTNGSEEDYRKVAWNTPNPDTTDAPVDGVAMQWNFYQRQLYTYVSYVVMGSFDSQSVVGMGYTEASTKGGLKTGTMDQRGPYWGTTSGVEGAKLFIENSWGSVAEWVDGAWRNSPDKLELTQSYDPSNKNKAVVVPGKYTSDDGWISGINTGAQNWGYPSAVSSSSTGFHDLIANPDDSTQPYAPVAGGKWNDGANAGISGCNFAIKPGDNLDSNGTRLAFLYKDPNETASNHVSQGYNYEIAVKDPSTNVTFGGVSSSLAITSVTDADGKVLKNASSGNPGSWTFDAETGVGPFNSFYALFDGQTGKMMYHLKPDNLALKLDGTAADLEGNNVMWVLPTVYWHVGANGSLVLSSTGTPEQAYAHTIDGHTYKYLAIGVYEATSDGKMLGSVTGMTPEVKTLTQLSHLAAATPLDSNANGTTDGKTMVWNFYQWELYKYVSYAVTGTFDMQKAIGYGNVDSNNISVTGTMNGSGPYSGTADNRTTGSKLFVENSWGSLNEWVSGYAQAGNRAYLSSECNSVGDTSGTAHVVSTARGFVSGVDTADASMWGFPTSVNKTAVKGAIDYFYGNSGSDTRVLNVGSSHVSDDRAGISYVDADYSSNFLGSYIGSRLAFVFDSDTPSTFELSYSLNGGAGGNAPAAASQSKGQGVVVQSLDSAVIVTGHEFKGWNTQADGKGTTYLPGETFAMPDKNTVLYAVWEPVKVALTLVPNHDDLKPTVQEQTYGEKYILPVPDRTGYTFDGWFDAQENGQGTKFTENDTVNIISPATYYAHWTAGKHAITFDANGGEETMNDMSVSYGQEVTLTANAFTYKGHTFTGWNTQADGQGTAYADEQTFVYRTVGDTKLYAQWDANTITVRYAPGGDNVTGSMPDQTFRYGDPVTPKANQFNNPGYGFSTWMNGKVTVGLNDNIGEIAESGTVILTAKWTGVTITVFYKPGEAGGDPIKDTYGYGGSETAQANEFTYTGHDFKGWAYNGKIVQPGQTIGTLSTKNYDLVATWKANDYKLSFDVQGGTPVPGEMTVTYGEPYGKLPSLAKTGYDFAGWKVGNVIISGTDTVSIVKDTEAVAQWTPKNVDISFAENYDGGKVTRVTGTYNKAVSDVKPADPNRDGYTFQGWYDAATAGTKLSDTAKVDFTEPRTYYAHWSPAEYEVTFDANVPPDSSLTSDIAMGHQKIAYGATAVLNPNKYAVEGYTFTGWNTVGDGSGERYVDGAEFTVSEPKGTILYAQWLKESYAVTYVHDGYTAFADQSPAEGARVNWHEDVMFKVTVADPAYKSILTVRNGDDEIFSDDEGVYTIPDVESDIEISVSVTCYTVTLGDGVIAMNGQERLASDDKVPSGTVLKISAEEREGYNNSLAADKGALDAKGGDYAVASDVKFTCTYTPIEYTMKFNTGGGTAVHDITAGYGSVITKPADPGREGYKFVRWSPEVPSTMPLGGGEYTAQWDANDITVEYAAGVPEGTTATGSVDSRTFGYGDISVVAADNGFKYAGHTFTGWMNGTTPVAPGNPIGTIATSGTVTLTAQWKTNEITVRYAPGEDGVTKTMDDRTFEYGADVKADACGFVYAGHTFTGWMNGTKSVAVGDPIGTIAESGTVTLTAAWDVDKIDVSFTVDLKNNWGAVTPNNTLNVPYGTVITVEGQNVKIGGVTVTAKENADDEQYDYGFAGWAANGTSLKDSYTVVGKTAVVASFSQTLQKYDVTVKVAEGDDNYGKISETIVPDVPYGSKIAVMDNVIVVNGTKVTAAATDDTNTDDYGFAGWTVNGEPLTDGYVVTGATPIVADFTHDVKKYTVTFDGGEVSVTAKEGEEDRPLESGDTVVYETVLTAAPTPKDGFDAKVTANGNVITGTYAVTDDVTFDTVYTEKEYEVTFDANGGTFAVGEEKPTSVMSETYGDKYNLPATPTYGGHDFVGWYTAAEDGTPITGNTVVGLDPATVYAHWELKEYTVTYTANNTDWGTITNNTVKVHYGDKFAVGTDSVTVGGVTSIAVPTATDAQYIYGFTGFEVDNADLANGTEIKDNVTVSAIFTQTLQKYTVSVAVDLQTPWGTVSKSSITDVPYGSTIAFDNTKGTFTLTYAGGSVDPLTVTASATDGLPQYDNRFSAWEADSQNDGNLTVAGDTTVTAVFSQDVQTYKVTVKVAEGDDKYGKVSVTDVPDVPYGSKISVVGNSIIIDGTKVTATANDNIDYEYEFAGWSFGGKSLTDGQTVAANMTITADFKQTQKFAVTYEDGIVVTAGSVRVESGDKVLSGTVLTVAPVTKTGNNATVSANGTPVTNGKYTVNAEVKFTVSYTPVKYTVTFDPKGGSPTPGDIEFTYGQTYTKLPVVSRDGYDFGGWKIGDALITDGSVVAITENSKAVAQWTPQKLTVTIAVDPAAPWGTVNEESITGVPYGSKITVKDNTITVNGTSVTAKAADDTMQYDYGFGKWSVVDGYEVKGDITVTASFTQKVQTYKVTVKVAEGDDKYGKVSATDVPDVPYGSKITVAGDVISVDGKVVKATETLDTAQYDYAFIGWSVKNGDAVKDNISIDADFSQTVKKYTVTIEGEGVSVMNGTTAVNSGDKVEYGTALTVSINPIDGSDGAVIASAGSIDGGKYTVAGDVTFTGTYTTKQIAVALQGDGHEKFTDITGLKNGKAPYDGTVTFKIAADPGYSDHVKVMNGTTEVKPIKGVYTVSGIKEAVTIEASSEISTYVVTVEVADGQDELGEVSSPKLTVPYGSKITVDGSVISVDGKVVRATTKDVAGVIVTFDRWTADGAKLVNGYEVKSSLAVTASFDSADEQCKVTYDSSEVTVTATVGDKQETVESGTLVGYGSELTVNPVVETGYGATLKANGNEISAGTYTVKGDVLFDTDYAPNPYTVKFTDPEFGLKAEPAIKTVTYGKAYGELPVLSKEGYDFGGWKIGDTVIDADSVVAITGNSDAVAQWAQLKFTVTVVVDPATPWGTVNQNDSVTIPNVPYGSEIIVRDNAVTVSDTTVTAKETDDTKQYDYGFDKWSVGDQTAVKGDLTVIASFSEKGKAYEVTFDANGGSFAVGSENPTTFKQSETYGDKYTLPADPALDGHTFAGWYTDATNGTAITEGTVVEITGPATYYAHWTQDTVKVTYKVNDGSWGTISNGSVTVPKNSEFTVDGNRITIGDITSVATETKDTAQYDYGFGSFSAGNDDKVTEDITVTVTFTREVRTYSVSVAVPDEEAGYGKVEPGSVSGVPYGATVSADPNDGSKLIVSYKDADGNDVTSTFTASATADGVQYKYAFVGWKLDGSALTKTDVRGDVTVTADFSRETMEYKVTLGDGVTAKDGNTELKSGVMVPYGTTIDLDMNDRTGYDEVFSAGGKEIAGSTYAVTGDVTITGEHVPQQFAVTFEGDGHETFTVVSGVKDNKAPYDGKVTFKIDVDPGYTNLKVAGASGMTFKDGVYSFTVTGATVINATSEISTFDIKVTVPADQSKYGSVSTDTISGVPYGSKITVDGNVISVDGKVVKATTKDVAGVIVTFDKWTIGSEALVSGYEVKSTITVTADFNTSDEQCKVTYDSSEVTVTDGKETVKSGSLVKYNTELTVSPVDRPGYGATLKANGNEISAGTYTVKGDVLFDTDYAPNPYTVKFTDPEFGLKAEPVSKTVTYGGTYGKLPVLSKEGYDFGGWKIGDTAITADSVVAITGNSDAVAQWTQQKFTVTVEVDPATPWGTVNQKDTVTIADVPYGSEIVVKDNAVTVSDTTVTAKETDDTKQYDYGFVKWSIDNKYEVKGDLTVTASFSEKGKAYEVTFDANGGSFAVGNEKRETVAQGETYGEKYTLPADPTLDGHTFAGWYTDATSGTAITGGTVVEITGPATYYAHWTQDTVTVTYVIKESEKEWGTITNPTVTVPKGSAFTAVDSDSATVGGITSTVAPNMHDLKSSFEPDGFTVGGEKLSAGYAVNGNITVEVVLKQMPKWFTVTVEVPEDKKDCGSIRLEGADGSTGQKFQYSVPAGAGAGTIDGNRLELSYTDPYTQESVKYVFDAVVSGNTAEFTYGFRGWWSAIDYVGGMDIVEDTVITADFTKVTNGYEVTIGKGVTAKAGGNDFAGGTLPYGTELALDMDNRAYYDEVFYAGDEKIAGSTYTVTEAAAITGEYVPQLFDVTFAGDGLEDFTDIIGVKDGKAPYGSTVTFKVSAADEYVKNLVVRNGGDPLVHEDNGVYSVKVDGDEHVTASTSVGMYKVTVKVADGQGTYGSVDPAEVTVPYGSKISVVGNTLTVYGLKITASENDTDDYDRAFAGWSFGGKALEDGQTVTGDMTVTAGFEQTQKFAVTYGDGIVVMNGSVRVASGEKVLDGTVLTVTPVAREGHSAAVNATGTTIADGKCTVNGDVSFAVTYTAEKYAVTFKSEGAELESKEFTYGQTYEGLPAPTRDGFDFGGWMIGDKVIADGSVVAITENSDAVAQWTPQKFTVTVVVDPASPWGTVNQKDKITIPDVPYGSVIAVNGSTIGVNGTDVTAKETDDTDQYDYGFVAWSIENNYDVKGDLTVTASFSQVEKKYDVNVSVAEGQGDYGKVTVTNVPDVPYGSKITVIGNTISVNGTKVVADPFTTDGVVNTFDKWSIEDQYVVKGDTTVTAFFKTTAVYTVTFKAADGTPWGYADTETVSGVPSGSVFEVDNGNGTVTIGGTVVKAVPYQQQGPHTYRFVSFSVNSGDKVTADTTVLMTFACDTAEEELRFDVASEDGSSGKYGSVTPVPDRNFPIGSEFTVDGDRLTVTVTEGSNKGTFEFTAVPNGPDTDWTYRFVSWSVETGDDFDGGAVTATFARDPVQCTVTIAGEGVTVMDGNVRVNSGDTVDIRSVLEVTIADRPGYSGTVTVGDEPLTGSSYTVSGGVTFTGTYDAIGYTMTFYDGGKVVDAIKQGYGTDVKAPADPKKTGYEFLGWFPAVPDRMPLNGGTYTAQWKEDGNVSAVFDDGIEGADESIPQTYGQKLVLPNEDPVRDGYTFAGWFVSAGENAEQVYASTTVEFTGEKTFYAHWSIIKYRMQYVAGEHTQIGGIAADQKVDWHNDITFTAEAYPGYSLKVTNNGVEVPGNNGTYTIKSVDEDVHIVSAATPIEYKIIFKENPPGDLTPEVDGEQTVAFDATVPLRANGFTVTGYDFTGWSTEPTGEVQYADGADYTLNSTGNVTLYAHWKAKEVSTTFVTGYKDGPTFELKQTYDGKFVLPDMSARTGYTFDGWFTAAKDGTEINGDTTVAITEPATYYAHWTAKTVTVSFDVVNEGVEKIGPIEETYETLYKLPDDPVCTGYTFVGWFTEGGDEVTSETVVMDLTVKALYAHWTAGDSYAVAFVPDYEGGIAVTIDETIGNHYQLPEEPQRTGYEFLGWFTDRTGDTQITEKDTVSLRGNETYYAHWEAHKAVVTFDPTGGSAVSETPTVTYGEPYGELPTTSLEGHTFGGWFTEKDGGSEITRETVVKVTAETVTLYAHWTVDKYSVHCDAGVHTSIDGVSDGKFDWGTVLTFAVTTDPGYDDALAVTVTVGGEEQAPDKGPYTVTVTGDVVIKATTAANTYDIMIKAGDHGSVLPARVENVPYGSVISVAGNVIVINGTRIVATEDADNAQFDNEFAGWSADGKPLADGRTVTDGMTITAAFTQMTQKYTVTYEGVGVHYDGAKLGSGDKVPYGAEITILRFPVPGHTWSVTVNGEPLAGSGYRVESDVFIEGESAPKEYTMTFVLDNGSENIEIRQGYSTVITKPADPVRTGYDFTGWNPAVPDSMPLNGGTYTAQWKAKEISVTFVAGYEGGPNIEQTQTYDAKYVLPSADRPGYDFGGWFAADGVTEITSDTFVKITEPATYYAHWTAKTVSVGFDANYDGAPGIKSIDETVGETYKLPADPARTGYVFVGWFTGPEGGDGITSAVTVTENVTELYARWTASVTDTFDAVFSPAYEGAESVTVAQTYGQKIVLPADPVREGYDFVGWHTADGAYVDENTVMDVRETVTYYAGWNAIAYTVTFVSGDPAMGTVSEGSVAAPYGSTVSADGSSVTVAGTTVTATAAEGYAFMGWNGLQGTVASDLTVTAVFGQSPSSDEDDGTFPVLIAAAISLIIVVACSAGAYWRFRF